MKPSPPLTFKDAIRKVSEAQQEAKHALTRQYPPGTIVRYAHGRHVISAKVLGQRNERIYWCYDLQVEGDSGKTYWLSAHRII